MKETTIQDLIALEERRQHETLMLIPSENYASYAVRQAVGSMLANKYSEGYPHSRYYQGNEFIDQIEERAQTYARELFGTPHANVQPYSGSPANSAIYFGLLKQGDTIMGLKLSAGGHLTHGHPDITFSGSYFHSVQYDVEADGTIDMQKVRELALKHKPTIITVGTTAYPRQFDWKQWRMIADETHSLLLADISHIAGLVAGGAHPSPVPYVDVVMFTTHKTLRGPRGAVILVTQRGLDRDPEMSKKIDRAVFPGLQGGPHNNTTAGIAVALEEALRPEFSSYAQAVVNNARTLASHLTAKGMTLVTGGTENHLIIINLQPLGLVGNVVAEALEQAGIVVNRNSIPHDPQPPFYPSGIRIGTPAVTTRGMSASEMELIASWIVDVIDEMKGKIMPAEIHDRKEFFAQCRKEISTNERLKDISQKVRELCGMFPIPHE